MKRDTSEVIDLDVLLTPQHLQQQESVQSAEPTGIDWDEILTEWSYQCPKGYPTIVDGKFVEGEELRILNEILKQKDLNSPFVVEQLEEAVTSSSLSTNPTDTKEAMVCLFVDAILTDNTILANYRQCLDKKLENTVRVKLVSKVKTQLQKATQNYGKNYGISGYAAMADFIASSLLDIKTNKANLVIINNGIGAADVIVAEFGSKIKPGMVRRDEAFAAIRKHAVDLIEQNYNIKGYYPDNWCPGDIYLFLNNKAFGAVDAKTLNIGEKSLNSYFYGSNNPKGSIIAVSLKMQLAQAGKGTTFIKNVVVDGVTPQDKIGKDQDNQLVVKFREVKRRLEKYYFSDAWKQNDADVKKVKTALSFLAKKAGLTNVPLKPSQSREFLSYIANNERAIKKAIDQLNNKLAKSIDTTNTFQQAYTRFVKNLKALNVDKVEGDSKDFLRKVEEKNKQENAGKLNSSKMQELLSQKAATYDLASVLIEKWTEKTKKLSPAFEDYLQKVKNPFIAITMFAIAQHGLNPDFYKAIGTNSGSTGEISEFPSNSVVDEKKSVQKLKVVDSPGQAGFYVEYVLNINNHKYRTLLFFRFSKDQIRVEVQKLAAI